MKKTISWVFVFYFFAVASSFAQDNRFEGTVNYNGSAYKYFTSGETVNKYQGGNIIKRFYKINIYQIKGEEKEEVLNTQKNALVIRRYPNSFNANFYYVKFTTKDKNQNLHPAVRGTDKIVEWSFKYRDGKLKVKGERTYVSCSHIDEAIQNIIKIIIRELNL